MNITPGTSRKGRAQGYTDYYKQNSAATATVPQGSVSSAANYGTSSRGRAGSYGPVPKTVNPEEDERKKALRRRLKKARGL